MDAYTKQNGTYVAPHYQTDPNATRNDNYSSRGNVNPYTGAMGIRAPDGGYQVTPGQSSYGGYRQLSVSPPTSSHEGAGENYVPPN